MLSIMPTTLPPLVTGAGAGAIVFRVEVAVFRVEVLVLRFVDFEDVECDTLAAEEATPKLGTQAG